MPTQHQPNATMPRTSLKLVAFTALALCCAASSVCANTIDDFNSDPTLKSLSSKDRITIIFGRLCNQSGGSFIFKDSFFTSLECNHYRPKEDSDIASEREKLCVKSGGYLNSSMYYAGFFLGWSNLEVECVSVSHP